MKLTKLITLSIEIKLIKLFKMNSGWSRVVLIKIQQLLFGIGKREDC